MPPFYFLCSLCITHTRSAAVHNFSVLFLYTFNTQSTIPFPPHFCSSLTATLSKSVKKSIGYFIGVVHCVQFTIAVNFFMHLDSLLKFILHCFRNFLCTIGIVSLLQYIHNGIRCSSTLYLWSKIKKKRQKKHTKEQSKWFIR